MISRRNSLSLRCRRYRKRRLTSAQATTAQTRFVIATLASTNRYSGSSCGPAAARLNSSVDRRPLSGSRRGRIQYYRRFNNQRHAGLAWNTDVYGDNHRATMAITVVQTL